MIKRHMLNEAPLSLSKKRFGKSTWQLSKEERIQFAIENCRRIRITYDDKMGGKGKNTRYLLPLVYGTLKNGKKAIRAFQTFGSTKRGVPKYKLFLLTNIGTVDLGNKKYYEYEQELINTGFNTSGDKSFLKIFSITPLAKDFKGNLANKNTPITSEPVKKDEIGIDADKSQQKNDYQQKQATSTHKTTKKQQNFLDNTGKNDYNGKVNSQEVSPVEKSNISQVQPEIGSNEIEKINAPETEPVSKQDIDGEKIDTNNVLTKSYNDMMSRMDNLYNDNEENDEEKTEEI